MTERAARSAMARRHTRTGSSGGGGRNWRLYLLVIVAVGSIAVVSTGLFTATPVVDLSGIDVVADPSSLLGLEAANVTCANSQRPLLELRNNLGERANVTVALVDANAGQLHVEDQRGSSVTFGLIAGGNVTVTVTPTNVSSLQFTVIARTSSDVSSTTRSVPVLDVDAPRCTGDR